MHFPFPRPTVSGRAAPEAAAASGERPGAAPESTPAPRGVAALALGAALLAAGCTDPYGRVDYGRTALLGVGVGGATALAAGALSDRRRPQYGYPGGYGGYGYGAPRGYHGGRGYGYAPPRGYYGTGAYGYGPPRGYGYAPPLYPGGGYGYGKPRGHYGGW